MEVLVAMSLLSIMATGILIALQVGLAATAKTNKRLMENRRVAGAQRILEQEIAGFMPVMAACGAAANPAAGTRVPFFQGEPAAMRFVSTYSLHEAWRGQPQILEFLVMEREDGKGVRLVVNEHLYFGPMSAGFFCVGPAGGAGMRYTPVEAGVGSFVLADSLAYCKFSYLTPLAPPMVAEWRQMWLLARWPLGVRIEMAPFADDASRLRPVTITERIQVNRAPEIEYADY